MTTSVSAAKSQLRQLVKKELSKISKETYVVQTQAALKVLFSLPEYKTARRISVYLSMPIGEIGTSDVVYNALLRDKSVFIPYLWKETVLGGTKPKQAIMNMVRLNSREDFDSFLSDSWGIPTPSKDSIAGREDCFDGGEPPLDLIVVPGTAFDKGLRRLGHGKGFYDSFLWRYREELERQGKVLKMPHLVGLALTAQVLPDAEMVPTDDKDWDMDSLITGDGELIRRKDHTTM